jgi:tetratricopeptide (TPR) repeat protein
MARFGHRAWALGLALLSTLPYLPSLRGTFCYDDKVAVGGNPDVCIDNISLYELFTHDYWGNDILRRREGSGWTHDSWRPLVTLSFRLNHRIGQLNTFPYHVTNVLMHALCTFVAYFAFLRMGTAGGARDPSLRARVATLLFALNPVHSECIANITSRADIMAATVVLLAFLLYFGGGGRQRGDATAAGEEGEGEGGRDAAPSVSGSHDERQSPPPPTSSANGEAAATTTGGGGVCTRARLGAAARSSGRWLGSMLLILVALMCKETALTVPVVFAAVDACLALPAALKAGWDAAEKAAPQQHAATPPSSPSALSRLRAALGPFLLALPLTRGVASATFAAATYYVRIIVMSHGYSLQSFANEQHNPLATIPDLWTRVLAKAYVQSWALGIMVLPVHLSHDHAASRPVTELTDPRNALTALVYGVVLGTLGTALWKGLLRPLWAVLVGVGSATQVPAERPREDGPREEVGVDDEAKAVAGVAAPATESVPAAHAFGGAAPGAPPSPPPRNWGGLHLWARVLALFGWILISYLPSSHALLYVAFVVAERTLYFPSIAVAMLVAEAFAWVVEAEDHHRPQLQSPPPPPSESTKASGGFISATAFSSAAASGRAWVSARGPRGRLSTLLLLLVSLYYAAYSGVRNMDWSGEESLLLSNLALYPEHNGFSLYGMGAVRYYQGRHEEAEDFLLRATKVVTIAEPHILLGQLYWRFRQDYEKAIESFSVIEHNTSPRKEILQNMGLLLMMAGKAPDTDADARKRAEYLVLAGHKAHGYPIGHPNIGALASNAACVRMLSDPWRYGNFPVAEELFAEAFSYRHASRPHAYRNAAYFYAISGRPQRAIEVADEGIAYVEGLRQQPNLPAEAHKEADDFVRGFTLAKLSVRTHAPIIERWTEEGVPGSKVETERRLAVMGAECIMDLLSW